MSHLNQALAFQLKASGLIFEREYFAVKGRRFRFDFAIPSANLLIDVQGGTYAPGKMGHTSGSGMAKDMEKYNLAVLQGWRVILLDSKMVKDGRGLMWIQLACSEGAA
jgi:hypothetical protein